LQLPKDVHVLNDERDDVMKSFLEQVHSLMNAKSKTELTAFIIRIAEKTSEEDYAEFLKLLENKRVIITDAGKEALDVGGILAKINSFARNIEEYEIEAYYYDNWDNDGYHIESDDGFCEDLLKCYSDATRLLNHGFFKEAANAFDLISDAIEEFDRYNENNDFGAVYTQSFIDENWLNLDLSKISIYKVYSALLSGEFNEMAIFNEMFRELTESHGKLTLTDYVYAGTAPISDILSFAEKWILYLHKQTAKATSSLLREAAIHAGKNDIEVMEAYLDESGKSIPYAYLNLCEMYMEQGANGADKAISLAREGLNNSSRNAFNRDDLAKFLSRVAKANSDDDAYRYATMECFYSTTQFEDFIPIMDLHDTGLKEAAIEYIDKLYEEKNRDVFYCGSIDFYEIHFLNRDYDQIFSLIESNNKALGWTGSVKSILIPLFIGLLSGFCVKAVIIEQYIGAVLRIKDTEDTLRCLRENIGKYTAEQERKWYDRCVSEAENRTDAIVSGGFRSSYYKAARLLGAIAEMRFCRGENEPMEIVQRFIAKYPRHTAFRSELRTVLNGSNLPKIKI